MKKIIRITVKEIAPPETNDYVKNFSTQNDCFKVVPQNKKIMLKIHLKKNFAFTTPLENERKKKRKKGKCNINNRKG